MKISVTDFIDRIVDGDFISSEMECADQHLNSGLKQLLSDFQTSIAQNKLSQQIMLITGLKEAVQVRLESGIINLPFANINRVDNFFDDPQAVVETNVYLITEAEDLNPSKFRIDELCTTTQLEQDPLKCAQKLIEMVKTNLTQIKDNLANKKDEK
ncbi:hypothetical protein ACWCL1_08455 [Ligilactobacillus sp. LYQ135]